MRTQKQRVRFRKNILLVLHQKKNTRVLDYSTKNTEFKRLEPHIQTAATRSALKGDTESVVALGTLTVSKYTKKLIVRCLRKNRLWLGREPQATHRTKP